MKQKRDLRNLKPIRTYLVSKKPCDTKDLPDCPRSVTPLIPITRGLKGCVDVCGVIPHHEAMSAGESTAVTPLIPITRGLKVPNILVHILSSSIYVTPLIPITRGLKVNVRGIISGFGLELHR